MIPAYSSSFSLNFAPFIHKSVYDNSNKYGKKKHEISVLGGLPSEVVVDTMSPSAPSISSLPFWVKDLIHESEKIYVCLDRIWENLWDD